MADETPSPFDPFPARARAYAELIRAEGEARLNAARAVYEEARANGEEARAQVAWTLLGQLEADLASVRASQRSAALATADLARKSHAASMLLYGAPIAAYTYARDAYKYFERQAFLEDPDLFYQSISQGSVTGEQFLNNQRPDAPCLNPLPEPQNALELIAWALERRYLPRPGTEAQRQFATVFRAVAGVAGATARAIERRREETRASVYDVWRPVKLLGVTPTEPERRILESTQP